ncbi:MAG: DUF2182 domain-containing protein [Bryobacteraceae bacterium]|nr:DUF2182 domain-containing protein [Bryobacteraceae bacterium]
MTPVWPGARGGTSASALQYFFWARPEWWTVLLSGVAWIVMLFHASRYAAHGIHHHIRFSGELANWIWMVAAVMLPLNVSTVALTAERSLWFRRHRAIAGFLTGYFAPWLLMGLAVGLIRQAEWSHTAAAASLGFAASAVWQQTAVHRRALAGCHRTYPLAPTDWQADRDCLRFGWTIGTACLTTCWVAMLACAFSGHSLIAMSSGLVAGFVERRSYRSRTRQMVMVWLLLATYYGVLAVRPLP